MARAIIATAEPGTNDPGAEESESGPQKNIVMRGTVDSRSAPPVKVDGVGLGTLPLDCAVVVVAAVLDSPAPPTEKVGAEVCAASVEGAASIAVLDSTLVVKPPAQLEQGIVTVWPAIAIAAVVS